MQFCYRKFLKIFDVKNIFTSFSSLNIGLLFWFHIKGIVSYLGFYVEFVVIDKKIFWKIGTQVTIRYFSFASGYGLTLVLMGGGVYLPLPLHFYLLKTIENVMRLCTVLIFFLFWVVVLNIWVFFTNLLWIDITPLPIKTKFKYVKNVHIFKATTKKINTVHNLITFSIIFTNKTLPLPF